MARATFYYHTKRLLEPDGYDDARAAIIRIYDCHKGRYGYRRITFQLRNDGILLNHKTVQKLMVEMNLYGKRKKAKYKSYKGDSVEQFAKELVKYIRYYNNDRIKLRLNGKSPVQYRALFQSMSASQ